MDLTTPFAALPATYRKALKTWRPVILYFANEHCPACEWAGPIFRQIAEPYRLRANIYMLNTSQSPRFASQPVVSLKSSASSMTATPAIRKTPDEAMALNLSEECLPWAAMVRVSAARTESSKHSSATADFERRRCRLACWMDIAAM